MSSANVRELASMFLKTVDATGYLPEPPRTRSGHSLALYSRSAKARALANMENLPLWQGCRSLLCVYVQVGRGKRCRSWFKDEAIAERLPRSGHHVRYSEHHVRRCRKLLEAVGLIRVAYVPPGSDFPDSHKPDQDGGGYLTRIGGNVVEVNMDALLREGPLWTPEHVLAKDAEEARQAARELREDLEQGDALPCVEGALEAMDEGAPEAAEETPEPSGEKAMHARPRASTHADSCIDQGLSSSKSDYLDLGLATSAPRGVALAGSVPHAHAGTPGDAGAPPPAPLPPPRPEKVASETPRTPDAASPSPTPKPRPAEREATNEREHMPGQRPTLTLVQGGGGQYPGRVPRPTRSPEMERATTRPGPPVTAEQMRLDIAQILKPQGRHGERLPDPPPRRGR